MQITPIGVSVAAPAKRPSSFQVFGERRSGTNFVAALLQANTGLEPKYTFGWKHGFPVVPVLPRETLFVVVVRDPLDWAMSFYRAPYEAHDSLLDLGFSEFIRAEWHAVFRPFSQQWSKWGYGSRPMGARKGQELQLDRHPIEGRRFRNILEMRRMKLQGHLSLTQRGLNAIVFRYEDLKADPAACLRIISRRFRVPLVEDVKRIDQTVSPNIYPVDRKDGLGISDEDRGFILSELDLALERDCGYLQPKGANVVAHRKRRSLAQAVAEAGGQAAAIPVPAPAPPAQPRRARQPEPAQEPGPQAVTFTSRRRQMAASA